MLVSGFIDGKLIYIIEFPFNTPDFVRNLQEKVRRWQLKLKGSTSTKGQFLRSADFDYRDYIKSSNVNIVYIINRRELEKYRKYIIKEFYQFLLRHAK